jgi:hypothetical protein
MTTSDRELRAAQNELLCRSVDDRIMQFGEPTGVALAESDFACECIDETCVERIRLSPLQFLAVVSEQNRFIVLRGHEDTDVEDVIAEREGFLIVSKRGAGQGV